MASVIDRPADTTEQAAFSVTIKAAELVTAIRNVAPFASKDDTLPSLCGIFAELTDGKVKFASTDRYMLGTTELELPADDYTGAGNAILPPECIKAISSAKPGSHDRWTLAVSAGMVTLTMSYDGTSSWRAMDGDLWPTAAYRKLLGEFVPCADGNGPIATSYNPEFLAKFAKIRNGESKPPTLKLTAGWDTRKAEPGNMTRFECGPVTGLICQIRGN